MEPSKSQIQHAYHTTEYGNREYNSNLQGYVVDSLGHTNGLGEPPEHNSSETKPVNFSIQTGEEFAFEFMRHRGIPGGSYIIPNSNGDPNLPSGYMELKSESGSEMPMHSALEKGQQKFDSRSSSLYMDKSNCVAPKDFQRNYSLHGNHQSLVHASIEASDSSKLKFCCSFGGKILPRPSDGKLRYVGGETRIICFSKDVQWQELFQKTRVIYDETHYIRYQLPGEDLDALVSVSCDEDLQNMMEECKILNDGQGSYKLRIFLFSANDLDDSNFLQGQNMDGDSEFQYLVAINGFDMKSRKSSCTHAAGYFPESNGYVLPVTPKASEAESQYYHGQMLNNDQGQISSVLYNYNPGPFAPVGGAGAQLQIEGHWGQEKILERPTHEEGESKNSDLSASYPLPSSKQCNGNMQDFISVEEEASVVVPKPNGELELTSSKNEQKFMEPIEVPSLLDTDEPTGPIDLSYFEPPVSSQRVFQSERVPREQFEQLCRLSKSDDLQSSPFIMAHSRSDFPEKDLAVESDGRSRTGTVSMQLEQCVLPESLGFVDSGTTDVGQTGLPEIKQSRADFMDTTGNIQKDNGVVSEHDMVESIPKETITDYAAGDIYQGGTPEVSKPQHPDILIDINDRFPRDILSDLFSKAIVSNSPSNLSPIQKDGAGVSVNIENHDPKSWSFFQKLAGNDFARKDHFDQDHIGFSPGLPKVEEEVPVSYGFNDGISLNRIDNRMNFGEDERRELPNGSKDVISDSDYHPSHEQMSDMMAYTDSADNTRLEGSEYEVGQNVGLLRLDPLLDIDMSSLQLIKNEDLEELRELGAGSFGTVYHGKWRGTDVAIKRIKRSCFIGRPSEQARQALEFWREAEILSKLHHPNVVAFYGVVQDGPGGTLATVTEFMVNGSLRHVLLQKERHLDRRRRLTIAMDAAIGMEYLHSKNIVHFDLKCDNLLVNMTDPSRPICKVGDFGLSKVKRNTLVSGGVRGTLPWMAPELLNGSSNKVSEKVDVFSFGIVLWEILTGEEPYASMHYGAIIGGIVSNQLRPTIPSTCDSEWRRLMEQCWAPDPIARPSFTEIARRLRTMSTPAQNKPTAKPSN